MPDVAISYYGRILSTYIVCRQRGDSHVTSFLGMTLCVYSLTHKKSGESEEWTPLKQR